MTRPILMKPPPGYEALSELDGVTNAQLLLLLKTLYGLKQSGRECFAVVHGWLIAQRFLQAVFDPCVFMHGLVIIAVYVDDLLTVGPLDQVNAFKSTVSRDFRCKDLGPANHLLSMKLHISDETVTIGQGHYVQRILQKFGMKSANSRRTPLDSGTVPPKANDHDTPKDTNEYQQIVGCINYLVTGSRPDLAFPVSLLSVFIANPSLTHWSHLNQVLRFLRIPPMELTFTRPLPGPTGITITAFADASWGPDPDTGRSTMGYVVQIEGNTVSWASKQQSCVAKSAVKLSIWPAHLPSAILIWVRAAVTDLGFNIRRCRLITDNEAAIGLVKDQKVNIRTKHISIHHHFVRERYQAGDFNIEHVPSNDNLADICTKALPRLAFERQVESLRVIPVMDPADGPQNSESYGNGGYFI